MRDDAEIENELIQNFAKGLLILKDARKEDVEIKEAFITEIRTVFQYLNSKDFSEKTKEIDAADFFMISADLIADASPYSRFKINKIRDLIINRMNSHTRNTAKAKILIYRLLLQYYAGFNDAYIEHRGITLGLRNCMFIALLKLNAAGADAYTEHLDGAFFERLKNMQAAENAEDEDKKTWKKNAMG